MRLIYLAGPYSHEDDNVKKQRVAEMEEALAFFARNAQNLCLYSPIVHWSSVAFNHDLPHDAHWWMEQDFFMIRQSSAMWVLTIEGWKTSFGVGQELEFAESINRDILYVVPDPEGYHITPDCPD